MFEYLIIMEIPMLERQMKQSSLPNASATPAPEDIRLYTAAAAEGNAETVNQFLKRWPRHIDAQDEKTWTALMYAAREGHEGLVILLLSQGANPAVMDRFDRTAHWFARRGGHTPIAALLRGSMKQKP